MRFSTISLSALLLATAAPAMADETAPAPAFKITGSATLTSDYRFRGLTQTDGDAAVQATVNVNHESGFYVGTFISTIDGDGSTPLLTGYGKAEIDLYGGFTKTLKNGVGVDVGLLYYLYAIDETAPNTDFFEPYAALTYTLGPVATKLGVAYAWGGQKGLDFRVNNKDDNIYAYGEASLGIPKTPLTLKGHLGYTNGSLGLANANPANDHYWDWSVTGEAVGGPLKVGVSYVDTTVTSKATQGFDNYARRLGRGSTVLAYVGVSF